LVESLDDEGYTARVERAFNATIGGHYRHCLDHFQMLLEALDAPLVDYDLRRRDVRIEREREFAREETVRLVERYAELPEVVLERPIAIRCKVSYGNGPVPAVESTVGREMTFAISHAVHHFALIGVMCAILDVELPEGFGVAPSTVKFQKSAAC
jgi:hypothetical protein